MMKFLKQLTKPCLNIIVLSFFVLLSNSALAQHRITQHTPVPVSQIPYYQTSSKPGWEERGPEWVKWLAVGVRFSNGSGTICYYDPETKYAYVISCGHLFSGKKLSYDRSQNPKTRVVEVFYHNEKKLATPQKYNAEILCYRNFSESVYDVALCRFKADWDIKWYASIAPVDYKLVAGQSYHSTGCDGLSEVAHYSVEYIKEVQQDNVTEIITHKNNPRGGRSGGGVMTDDGQLIFICSRGNSNAYWSSLNQIHRFLKEEKDFEFLLSVGNRVAAHIPILNSDNTTRKYIEGYVPLP